MPRVVVEEKQVTQNIGITFMYNINYSLSVNHNIYIYHIVD